MQTGEIKPDWADLDVFNLSQETIAKISLLAEDKGIRLVNDVPYNAHLFADRMLVGQVLLNLLTNAIKFTPRGGTITVYMSTELTLAVRDSGIGINGKTVSDLFRHDVRTVGYGTDGEIGTGLGLPFCQDIMTAHGGTLRVETGDTGSTFFAEFHRPL
jgi:signal transduction histidine kinase